MRRSSAWPLRCVPARSDVPIVQFATEALYDTLLELMPSPIVQLNRAIARRYLDGAEVALPDVDALAEVLDDYYLFHATRAELLRDLGRDAEARAALGRALELTTNPAERTLLQERLG